jgi:acyl-CoA thioester hydrolase
MNNYLYKRRIQFYETDLMGIVHHANYVRLFEEARVDWALAKGLIEPDKPETASAFAVLEVQVWHLKTLKFGEDISIRLQVKRSGVKVIFEYHMENSQGVLVAKARTQHVNLNSELKPRRLPEKIIQVLESEKWIETWL